MEMKINKIIIRFTGETSIIDFGIGKFSSYGTSQEELYRIKDWLLNDEKVLLVQSGEVEVILNKNQIIYSEVR